MSIKLSEDLQEYVDELGLSNKDLANLCGVSVSTIRNALKNLSTSDATAEALANLIGPKIYDVDPSDPYGVLRGYRQARRSGASYEIRVMPNIIQVGIEHPKEGFLVRATHKEMSGAVKARDRFNAEQTLPK